jgi:carboxyl-terminal processing protease
MRWFRLVWFWTVAWLPIGALAAADAEGNIARVIAALLERSHFAAHDRESDISGKFLDRYLDALDGAKLHFTAGDLEEFAPYRENLAELTLQAGDVAPAHRIYARFLERLEQRVAFVKAALSNEVFTFTGHDTYRLDRRSEPRPTDRAAAEQLWRQQLRYEYLQEKLADKPEAEIVGLLARRYARQLRAMQQLKPDQVVELYLAALAHVYDPHSDYLGPRQLEEFAIGMRNSLFGIGAILQYDDGYCKIRELVPGGPAATSQLLKPGDRIVAVAQGDEEWVDIVEMPLAEAVRLIRGPKGTTVRLTILPAEGEGSTRKVVALVRDEIKIESQQAKAWIVDDAGAPRLGIIQLPSFYQSDGVSATADVAALIAKLQQANVAGLILDLRLNGGGSLEEAIKLTGLFFDYGPVVQTKDAEGRIQVSRDPDPLTRYDGPLVVLTSRLSASASEILAAAIQDYGRGIVVGDPATFGKGTVQSMIQLATLMPPGTADNPGALKLTIRKFYRPSGASTQLKGVTPDIVLPTPTGVMKVGEAEMAAALPWDEVPVVRYRRLERVAPHLETLRAKSAARIAADPEFAWLREDLERFQQRRDQPVVSLNEAERRREKAEREARRLERQRLRAARSGPVGTRYEITLKDLHSPGLPEPVSAALTNATLAAVGGDDGVGDEDKLGDTDVVLEETKRILVDYIAALGAGR